MPELPNFILICSMYISNITLRSWIPRHHFLAPVPYPGPPLSPVWSLEDPQSIKVTPGRLLYLIVRSSVDFRSLAPELRQAYETCSLAPFSRCLLVPAGVSMKKGSHVRWHPWTLHLILEVLRILDPTLFGLPLKVRVCCYQQLYGHGWNCCVIFTTTTNEVAKDLVKKISFVI